MARSIGGSVSHHGQYPGWESEADSPVSLLWQSCYRAVTGREISSTVIHAGLECGIFAEKLDGIDCVSIGPDNYDIHTTEERLSISSFVRVWEYLKEVLKNI